MSEEVNAADNKWSYLGLDFICMPQIPEDHIGILSHEGFSLMGPSSSYFTPPFPLKENRGSYDAPCYCQKIRYDPRGRRGNSACIEGRRGRDSQFHCVGDTRGGSAHHHGIEGQANKARA